MASARRTKVRKSLFALLVSYLRDGVVDTAKFTAVAGQAGTYPFTQNVWTFSLGSDLYQIMMSEAASAPLLDGVTLQFGPDIPDTSKAMPQEAMMKCGIIVRAPLLLVPTQESIGQQIALKIDQAFYRANGRTPLMDFDAYPAVPTTPPSMVTWTKVPRGSWEFKKATGPIEEFRLLFEVRYSQPAGEW